MTSGNYFASPEDTGSAGKGTYARVDELPVVEMAPGLTLRPILATGMMVSFVHYEPHAEAPLHSHVEEQAFIVLEGELEMEMAGDVRQMRPGDLAIIPSGVPHRVTAGSAPARQLDVFCPPRQALLEALAAAQAQLEP